MIPWLFASVLVGGVLAAIEYIFIIYNSGPFWLGSTLFLQTWSVYTLLSLAGSLLLNSISSLIPPINNYISEQPKRLLFLYFFTWLFGSAALLLLMLRDLDSDGGFISFIIISLILGIGIWLIGRKLFSDSHSLLKPFIVLTGIILIVTAAVFLLADSYYSSQVHRRNEDFNESIPHICLIIFDTARGDHYSCNGYHLNTSPNLDKFAKEGLLCRQAHSSSNWTPPGHISIFTGKYPSQHGNDGKPYMPDHLVSFAEILNDKGFYCLAVYNNRLAGKDVNITQGFDQNIGVFRHSWVYPAWMRLSDKLIHKDSGAKSSFRLALDTYKWFDKKGGRLFLYLNILEPHQPYVIHEPYFSMFTKTLDIDGIPNLPEVKNLCFHHDKVVYDSSRFARYTEDSYRFISAVYDSEIAYVDHHFGKFTDGMRKADLLDSTLTIVTADHGEFLGEHYTRAHPPIMFKPVTSIPLVIRYTPLIKSEVVDDIVSNVDILPTVLNLMGNGSLIPEDVEGIDILADRSAPERYILSEKVNYDQGCFSMYNNSQKLMINTDKVFYERFPFDTLLFNLQKDPDEADDIHFLLTEMTDSLADGMERWISDIRVVPAQEIEISDQVRESLKALGYVQ
ncbi:hypothetical protein CEE37_13645 [candidate division LCP-89 bacterium B3_LCP]|uniref:Sulfatase N-terminal domain-containing protein n=1 Tax=candidate division LCP-89 bacterium B3_LCP TaxID=2012998 RepID=A0A532URI3_UNCL8|nr:MAG: hypothetical protein CEE37_13645 [candidate division LCP-89 bacterium B3_LCP]